MDIQTKRIYEKPANRDGTRILVDRVWPRGVSKEDAKLDEWMKEIAPSTDLRKWFDHEEKRLVISQKNIKKNLKAIQNWYNNCWKKQKINASHFSMGQRMKNTTKPWF